MAGGEALGQLPQSTGSVTAQDWFLRQSMSCRVMDPPTRLPAFQGPPHLAKSLSQAHCQAFRGDTCCPVTWLLRFRSCSLSPASGHCSGRCWRAERTHSQGPGRAGQSHDRWTPRKPLLKRPRCKGHPSGGTSGEPGATWAGRKRPLEGWAAHSDWTRWSRVPREDREVLWAEGRRPEQRDGAVTSLLRGREGAESHGGTGRPGTLLLLKVGETQSEPGAGVQDGSRGRTPPTISRFSSETPSPTAAPWTGKAVGSHGGRKARVLWRARRKPRCRVPQVLLPPPRGWTGSGQGSELRSAEHALLPRPMPACSCLPCRLIFKRRKETPFTRRTCDSRGGGPSRRRWSCC